MATHPHLIKGTFDNMFPSHHQPMSVTIKPKRPDHMVFLNWVDNYPHNPVSTEGFHTFDVKHDWLAILGKSAVAKANVPVLPFPRCIFVLDYMGSKTSIMVEQIGNRPWVLIGVRKPPAKHPGYESYRLFYRAHVTAILMAMRSNAVSPTLHSGVVHAKQTAVYKGDKTTVLDLLNPKRVSKMANGKQVLGGYRMRQHDRRAHVRTLANGDQIIVRACKAGDPSIGVIKKKYQL